MRVSSSKIFSVSLTKAQLTLCDLATIWSSETNLEILKDSCNPRLKSVVFDRWFDMSTDSRLMAVAINFFLRLNSGSVRRFQTLSCSVTSPTTTVKPRTNRCAEPDDAISATTSNHENVETSQVDSTTGRKTYWAMEGKGVLVWRVVAWQG